MGYLDDFGQWGKSIFTGEEQEDSQSKEMIDKIMETYNDVELPEYVTPEYKQLDYDPLSSEWDNVQADEALREQQLSSLGALEDIYESGGMTAQDEANLNRIQDQTATADRGRREAINQNMAMRGMGGSGQELLAQLSSSQAATNQAAQQGLDVAGTAQERALNAMMQGGQIAGQVRSQDFGEAGERASKLDAIGQFNKQNQIQSNVYNTDQYNRGQDMQNQQSQQAFDNRMTKAAGQASGYGAGADFYTQVADRKQRAKGQVVQGAAKIGASAAKSGGGE